jgi:riboflavin kinase/FMN adenylyltransferase
VTDLPAQEALGGPFHLVAGVDGLEAEHGPLFAVVGVFDGLHLGHQWLLEALRSNAERLEAKPAVITFDSHPDEVLVGAAPPLLLDPHDRHRLLRDAGVAVVVVQHFDAALRATPYDAFVRRITDRVRLAGLLMTPETAFGHERRGTPAALTALGRAGDPPFEVVIVPTFTVEGSAVSSSDIRRRVAEGDLAGAAVLLGRPYGVAGTPVPLDEDRGTVTLTFGLPVALPPEGDYRVTVVDADVPGPATPTIATVRHEPASVVLASEVLPAAERLRVVFD